MVSQISQNIKDIKAIYVNVWLYVLSPLRIFAFQSFFANGSLLTNVEKEIYLGFVMTSRNDENDRPTTSKETIGLCMLEVICYSVNSDTVHMM